MKLLTIIEQNILKPRRTGSERSERKAQIDYQKILKYIEDGSKGNLDLEGSSITKLPDSLTKVGGNLNLYGTPITQLPDNLKVEGYLDLRNTSITKLPDNLKVGDGLYLYNTPITQLPDNLKVYGSLWIQNTPLSKQYTKEQILQMIEDKGGFIKGRIRM